MTDIELLERAIEASGLSARRFAVRVLDVDERTVRRWEGNERAIPGPVLQLCRLVIENPRLVLATLGIDREE